MTWYFFNQSSILFRNYSDGSDLRVESSQALQGPQRKSVYYIRTSSKLQ